MVFWAHTHAHAHTHTPLLSGLCLLLEVSEKEEGVVAIHIPIGPSKNPALDWSWYWDANSLPTSPLADALATTIKAKIVTSW